MEVGWIGGMLEMVPRCCSPATQDCRVDFAIYLHPTGPSDFFTAGFYVKV